MFIGLTAGASTGHAANAFALLLPCGFRQSTMPNAKPHVILIAYHFPPGPEIGAVRPFRFHKYLTRMGYRCHVITASPQTAASNDVIFLPDELREVWEGTGGQQKSFRAYQELLVRKIAFPGHIGIMWSLGAAARCHELLRRHPGEKFVVFSTYPPLGVIPAGLMAYLRDRLPWIADFRDPLGVGLGDEFTSANQRFWNHQLEARVFRQASAVIANVEGAAEMWRKLYPRAARKLHVIPNGFDPEDAPRAREIPPGSQKLIVHAGGLYHGRNPNLIVEALARLRASTLMEATTAKILLVGSIDAKTGLNQALCEQGQREGWLELRPPVTRGESQRLMEEADALLLVQPQSDVQVPGKLFEYICIGRPVLALVPRNSAVEEILRKSGIPNVCVYADDGAQDADRKLMEFLRLPNTPRNASDWFRANFNAEEQTKRLAEIIDSVSR
jgi:glycosyltransferase involved in cell wall biosynthesis